MKLLITMCKEIEAAISNILESAQPSRYDRKAETAITQAITIGRMDADEALIVIENDPALTIKIRSELGSLLGKEISNRDFYNLAKNKKLRGDALSCVAAAMRH